MAGIFAPISLRYRNLSDSNLFYYSWLIWISSQELAMTSRALGGAMECCIRVRNDAVAGQESTPTASLFVFTQRRPSPTLSGQSPI